MRARSALVAGLLLLLATALPFALAASENPGFGKIVNAPTGTDGQKRILTGGPATFSFIDTDSSGTLSGSEEVYLTAGSTLQAKDVRLANAPGTPGTQLQSGDSRVGTAVATLSGQLRFLDADGTGKVSGPDAVYFDRSGTGDGVVSFGDVILSGSQAGNLVASGSQNTGVGLTDLSATIGYYDADKDNTYDAGEAVVLDLDLDGFMTVGDLRLGSTSGGSFGTLIKTGDSDLTFKLRTDVAPQQWVYWDRNSDSAFNANDVPFLSTASDRVTTFSVRLANPEVSSAGTLVVEGDPSWNVVTTTFPGTVGLYDLNGNNLVDSNEAVYLDRSGSGQNQISIGDVIIAGNGAGTIVSGGSSNIGQGLSSLSASIAIFDGDGNQALSHGDIVYLDVNGDGFANKGDVQLSVTPVPGAGGSGPPTGQTTGATVTITAPPPGSEFPVGEPISVSGSAEPGVYQGAANTISSLVVTVNGAGLEVPNAASWSGTFTPSAPGTYTFTATLTPSQGSPVSTSVSVTAVGDAVDPGTSPGTKECPGGETVPEDESCPGVDEQAREDAGEARDLAEEARDAAQEAGETAQEAKEAAEGAKEANEEASNLSRRILDQLQGNGSSDGDAGVPGAGLLIALLVLALVARFRRR